MTRTIYDHDHESVGCPQDGEASVQAAVEHDRRRRGRGTSRCRRIQPCDTAHPPRPVGVVGRVVPGEGLRWVPHHRRSHHRARRDRVGARGDMIAKKSTRSGSSRRCGTPSAKGSEAHARPRSGASVSTSTRPFPLPQLPAVRAAELVPATGWCPRPSVRRRRGCAVPPSRAYGLRSLKNGPPRSR